MTIRELAKLAGVSHSTASRALRDHPRIGLETRQAIQALARTHGYSPHPIVSELMAQLPQIRNIARSTIAIVTCWADWRSHAFLKAIHTGVEDRASQLGYRLEEVSLLPEEMSPERVSKVLYARGIEGVLVYPFQRSPVRLDLDWGRFCGVAIGRSMAQPALHRVTASYYENVMLALHELQALGYKRIALALTTALRTRVDDAYLAAYSLYERGLAAKDRIPVFMPEDAPPVEKKTRAFLDHGIVYAGKGLEAKQVIAWLKKHRADALLCNGTPSLEELLAAGLRVPEDVGYVALDKIAEPAWVSGIDQQPERMGSAAVDLLTSHLHRHEHGVPVSPKVLTLQSRWIPGKTVRPQAGASPTAKTETLFSVRGSVH